MVAKAPVYIAEHPGHMIKPNKQSNSTTLHLLVDHVIKQQICSYDISPKNDLFLHYY
jgi:hypothetical protein